ncbi:T6SS immunity protein Tdi1 domain-containing protein [Tateyamaria sp. ANG-S1]|uniref:T6SS immunity protein Tdi1 domain-containing protein n=1 Tax=Tateyamaria sp. ANG-S1 TaxID=1577905 RepID=UPI00068A68EE|nr:T6SS immunity protein Tdi1 domain-containing protein [Tateyamaria sp. ANG-S1]
MNRSNQAKDIAAGDVQRWAERCFHQIKLDRDNIYGSVFSEATARLGLLGADQMLGLVPAAPLGGQFEAENLQIFSAPEHLAMLAQIGQRRVMTFDDLARQAFGDASVESLNRQLGD